MGATERLKEQTGLAKKPVTMADLLNSLKPQMALALPKHLQADRMIRIALTALRTSPQLMACEPQSILASVMTASQLGLEIGVLGQAFLVPYKREGKGICTLIPGWQGLVDLVSRAGRASAWTGAVRLGDQFNYELGGDPRLVHVPTGDDEKLTHVYAVGRVFNSPWPILEVWTIDKVKKHRDRYNRVGAKHYSFTNEDNFEMYARKVALMQVLKYLPKSIELAAAYDLDQQAETGSQHLKIEQVREVLEGTLMPPDPEPKGTERMETPEGQDEREASELCEHNGCGLPITEHGGAEGWCPSQNEDELWSTKNKFKFTKKGGGNGTNESLESNDN